MNEVVYYLCQQTVVASNDFVFICIVIVVFVS